MNLIREIVSGKRQRTKETGYDLDLSYVCPRVIAMSFPAEGIETIYRNNIKDVVNYIKERHSDDYHIYNLSGRSYQKSKFKNQVSDFPWEDHHSPPIHVLFQCCQSIDEFLAQKVSNVIIIHCLAGKGRTGSALCCYLIYSGRFSNADQALVYYMKRRFYQGGGVSMPSQIRYVHYFEELIKNYKRTPTVKYITSITLTGVPIYSKHSCRPFIEIYNVKEHKQELIYCDKKGHSDQKKYRDLGSRELNIIKIQILKPFIVAGDILIKVYHNGKFKDVFMFRLAFNTAFIPDDNQLLFELSDLDPHKLIKDKRYPEYFYCEVKFQDYCSCTNKTMFENKCKECSKFLQEEQKNWKIIHDIMREYQQHTLEESQIYLFGDKEFDDVDEVLFQNTDLENQNQQQQNQIPLQYQFQKMSIGNNQEDLKYDVEEEEEDDEVQEIQNNNILYPQKNNNQLNDIQEEPHSQSQYSDYQQQQTDNIIDNYGQNNNIQFQNQQELDNYIQQQQQLYQQQYIQDSQSQSQQYQQQSQSYSQNQSMYSQASSKNQQIKQQLLNQQYEQQTKFIKNQKYTMQYQQQQ